jgi:hypothetical protein
LAWDGGQFGPTGTAGQASSGTRRDGTFKGKLKDEYRRFWEFWKTLGILLVPPW